MQGGRTWTWHGTRPWFRVYHRGGLAPSAVARRRYGPQARFDHHQPSPVGPAEDGEGRAVLYLADRLGTAAVEVFGDLPEAPVCPNHRAALVVADRPVVVQNLVGTGAMALGALPALGSGPVARELSQEWARAIYEDRPAGPQVTGIRYRSAHDEGPCLALWETAPRLRVLTLGRRRQDFALRSDALWPRLLQATAARALPVVTVESAACRWCHRDAMVSRAGRAARA